jgi:hypothetical protein
MKSDLERFNQGLQDLLFAREQLQADLPRELGRSNELAKAINNLRRLNDAAQDIIEKALYGIGMWVDPEQHAPPPLPDIDMPNIARGRQPLPSERFADDVVTQVNGRLQ